MSICECDMISKKLSIIGMRNFSGSSASTVLYEYCGCNARIGIIDHKPRAKPENGDFACGDSSFVTASQLRRAILASKCCNWRGQYILRIDCNMRGAVNALHLL